MPGALITNHTEIWILTARLFGVPQGYFGKLFCHVNQEVKWKGWALVRLETEKALGHSWRPPNSGHLLGHWGCSCFNACPSHSFQTTQWAGQIITEWFLFSVYLAWVPQHCCWRIWVGELCSPLSGVLSRLCLAGSKGLGCMLWSTDQDLCYQSWLIPVWLNKLERREISGAWDALQSSGWCALG